MIKSIDAYALGVVEPLTFGSPERCLALVRIETDEGHVGWGEGIAHWREAAIATKALIDGGYAALVIGRDPIDVIPIWRDMCMHSFWYGVEGIAAFAISAVDMALWDVLGKVQGQPVAKLLGGLVQPKLPAMASTFFNMEDIDALTEEFRGFAERGYTIAKAGWGRSPDAIFGTDRERDMRVVGAMREAVGPDVDLVLDVPGAIAVWDTPTTIRRFAELDEFRLRWIEEPLPPKDLAAHARVRATTRTPLGTGEAEWSPEGYARLIEAGAADVLQIDPGRCLGLTGAREVIRMAEAAHLKVSAHSFSSAVNTAASMSFLTTSPAGDTLDFKAEFSSLQHELVSDPWEPVDGFLEIREAPGLGVTVDEDYVKEHSIA
jgi:L-alanine-DL-glutamate epimerase-like enolase superfamily enzyme